MKSAQTTGLVVAILIAAAAAGFGVYKWMQPNRSTELAEAQNATPPAMTLQQAMTLPLDDLNGTPHTLADWRGKVMLVNFWATWCPPCREEIPLLVKLQAKYAARGLQVIGIATDETDEDGVRTFTRHMLVNYPILMGNEQVSQMVAGLGGDLIGLPYTLLVDRDGRVVKLHPGQLDPAETEKWVSDALHAESAPAPAPAATPAPQSRRK
ncbi:MAG TPA: TlpA disulfide reductase family protein [Gammaproteobacteria bacterium]|jgi:thiol-disulfide isomerase/thioredoxin|nr:TlpA disulfide reductase family protein [Gammaproteobacteria bacterium]